MKPWQKAPKAQYTKNTQKTSKRDGEGLSTSGTPYCFFFFLQNWSSIRNPVTTFAARFSFLKARCRWKAPRTSSRPWNRWDGTSRRRDTKFFLRYIKGNSCFDRFHGCYVNGLFVAVLWNDFWSLLFEHVWTLNLFGLCWLCCDGFGSIRRMLASLQPVLPGRQAPVRSKRLHSCWPQRCLIRKKGTAYVLVYSVQVLVLKVEVLQKLDIGLEQDSIDTQQNELFQDVVFCLELDPLWILSGGHEFWGSDLGEHRIGDGPKSIWWNHSTRVGEGATLRGLHCVLFKIDFSLQKVGF